MCVCVHSCVMRQREGESQSYVHVFNVIFELFNSFIVNLLTDIYIYVYVDEHVYVNSVYNGFIWVLNKLSFVMHSSLFLFKFSVFVCEKQYQSNSSHPNSPFKKGDTKNLSFKMNNFHVKLCAFC